MDSASLIRHARVAAGLSQRELAANAHTSAAAICLYESGQRIPRVDTLTRLIAATGRTLVLDTVADDALDPVRNGEILVQVLELSEHFPFRRDAELSAPTFADLAV